MESARFSTNGRPPPVLGQGSQSLLARDRDISRIDAAAGVNILSKVGRRDRLKRLLPHQRNIRCIDPTARIHVTKQYTHSARNISNVAGNVRYAGQSDGDELGIRHAGKIHSAGVPAGACTSAPCAGAGGAASGHTIREVK